MRDSEDAGGTDERPHRRSVLRAAGGILAGASVVWVAPAVLSVDAASAATQGPPPLSAVAGTVSFCNAGQAPFSPFLVSAGGSTTTTGKGGAYSIPLPPGTYTVTFQPQGGGPVETDTGVVVGAGVTTHDHLYTSTC